jgi:hypothetical protein
MTRAIVVTTVVILALAGTVAAQRRGEPVGGEVKAVLLAPPGVPPAIQRSAPAKVVVELETT